MTDREVFNKVRAHLLAQNTTALDENGNCRYRNEQQGLKCAIGCLIPDQVYQTRFEGHDIRTLVHTEPTLVRLFAGVDLDLLIDLQVIHDKKEVEHWPKYLSTLEARLDAQEKLKE